MPRNTVIAGRGCKHTTSSRPPGHLCDKQITSCESYVYVKFNSDRTRFAVCLPCANRSASGRRRWLAVDDWRRRAVNLELGVDAPATNAAIQPSWWTTRELLLKISGRLDRMESTMAEMRREAADAHEAIGERIHNSFMALDRKIDREISVLSSKIDDLSVREASDTGRR